MEISTGVVRKLDSLGRIVVPIELRRELGMEEHATMEYLVDLETETMALRRLHTGCLFCGSTEAGAQVHGQQVCPTCCRQAAVIVENRRVAAGD